MSRFDSINLAARPRLHNSAWSTIRKRSRAATSFPTAAASSSVRSARKTTRSCDFGLVVAGDWHETGIAGLLMLALMAHARARGFRTMESIVLRDNGDMLRFVRALGFELSAVPGERTLLRATRQLARYASAGSASRN